MSDEEAATLEEIMGEKLRELGYPIAEESVLAPLRGAAGSAGGA